MNAFHVIGGLTAIWAVIVAVLGITRESFPGRGAEKVVALVSVIMVVGTISAAVLTSGNEEDEHGGGAEEAAESQSH